MNKYAAVKALAHRPELQGRARPVLERQLGDGGDPRLVLEVASTAAATGANAGRDYIRGVVYGAAEAAMKMEAVFILTELGRGPEREFALAELAGIAYQHDQFKGSEVRQAAVWGLGHAGARAFEMLIPYLNDPDQSVALHAIAAFSMDTPMPVVERLVGEILTGDDARAASCSAALQTIGSEAVLTALARAATTAPQARRPWIVATLGRMPEPKVRLALQGTPLLTELAPMLLGSAPSNWLARESTQLSLAFLQKQSL